ncbi:zinc ran-binding domain protein 3 [Ichthyophthirius multifiliis]|uniref:Zinc ran-binding domain protein 3 n=1 Tax=Ichthyophthirius multifiliis TaxID=5932 RepID=G0QRN1_ICHMU|nr:zinc ran-binding domain protein 3 [Ichthyophthirius multifiliis]EGR32130.1 zinc ran-binding domain protein 3 [Ichthyophthirius multifiliis]|eukprot:XP_004035616.1 zinc ran-binding domain protein 3 [Ichthyophthirius multifiliis]
MSEEDIKFFSDQIEYYEQNLDIDQSNDQEEEEEEEEEEEDEEEEEEDEEQDSENYPPSPDLIQSSSTPNNQSSQKHNLNDDEQQNSVKKDQKHQNEEQQSETCSEYIDNCVILEQYDKKLENKEKITPPFLTKYEKARVIGTRALQIAQSSPIYVDTEDKEYDPIVIAEKEFALKKFHLQLEDIYLINNMKIGLQINCNIKNDETNNDNNSSIIQNNAINLCYKLSGLAKLEELKNYIQDLLENDIKLIIFAHHKEVLLSIEEFVNKKLEIQSIRIDGSVQDEERHKKVALFQQNKDTRVAILSITAASTGLTLTASSNVVFAEMHWTPALLQQAEDRAHRIGQSNSVLCHYILGEGTLDEHLYKQLESKTQIVGSIIDGESKQFKMDQFEVKKQEKQSLTKNQFQKILQDYKFDDSDDDEIYDIQIQNQEQKSTQQTPNAKDNYRNQAQSNLDSFLQKKQSKQ